MTAPTQQRIGPGPARRPPRRPDLRALQQRAQEVMAGPWVLRVAVGVAVLIAAVALLISTERSQTRAEQAEDVTVAVTAQRDQVAQDLQEDATTISALCATGSEVARALDAAGQCGRAAQRLTDPLVASQESSLTPTQIDAIVARVLALSPQPATLDEVVTAVLARVGTDPALRGLNELEVRSIVAAAIAALPVPRDGQDGRDGAAGDKGDNGQPGVSFGGLIFARQGGRCVAVVTFIDPDGTSRTQSAPVGDGACDPVGPPPTTVPPEPEPTTDPPPPPTTDPPAPPTGGESGGVDPTTAATTPSTPPADGLVPGLIG